MKKELKKKEIAKKNLLLNNYQKVRLEVFGQTAIYTLLTIIVFGLIGYLLDKYLGTYPKLLIGGVVLSYPLNLILTRRRFKKLATDKLNKFKNGSN